LTIDLLAFHFFWALINFLEFLTSGCFLKKSFVMNPLQLLYDVLIQIFLCCYNERILLYESVVFML